MKNKTFIATPITEVDLKSLYDDEDYFLLKNGKHKLFNSGRYLKNDAVKSPGITHILLEQPPLPSEGETAKLLSEINDLLAHLEDFTHGKDGEDITKMRKRIYEFASHHLPSQGGGEIENNQQLHNVYSEETSCKVFDSYGKFRIDYIDWLEQKVLDNQPLKRVGEKQQGEILPIDWWDDDRFIHLKNAHTDILCKLILEYDGRGKFASEKMQEIADIVYKLKQPSIPKHTGEIKSAEEIIDAVIGEKGAHKLGEYEWIPPAMEEYASQFKFPVSSGYSEEDLIGFAKWLDDEEIPYEGGSFLKWINGNDTPVSVEWLMGKYLQKTKLKNK